MGKVATENLTKARIENITPGDALIRIPDAQVRGLVLQVTPGGIRSWVLRFRVHGRQVNHTLGRWPDLTVAQARAEAVTKLSLIQKGENPSDQRRVERLASTVSELVERFAAEHLDMNLETMERLNPGSTNTNLKTSTAKEYARILKRHVLPTLGTLRVKDITPGDVAEMLFKLRKDTKGREGTPILANRVRAVLSKLFTKAELWGLRPGLSNPAKGQDRAPERKKDRHLSDRELVTLGIALKAMEPMEDEAERTEKDPLAAIRFI